LVGVDVLGTVVAVGVLVGVDVLGTVVAVGVLVGVEVLPFGVLVGVAVLVGEARCKGGCKAGCAETLSGPARSRTISSQRLSAAGKIVRFTSLFPDEKVAFLVRKCNRIGRR